MALPQQKYIRHEILFAQQKLATLEKTCGKDSSEYKAVLTHLTRMWFVLKMTRSREDFLQEVI